MKDPYDNVILISQQKKSSREQTGEDDTQEINDVNNKQHGESIISKSDGQLESPLSEKPCPGTNSSGDITM